VEARGDALGFLYVDGHVRVYHGKHRLPKAHVARMGGPPQSPAGGVERCRPDRLGAWRPGCFEHQGKKGGQAIGPNPTDRGKNGTKHHLITDANGIPMAVRVPPGTPAGSEPGPGCGGDAAVPIPVNPRFAGRTQKKLMVCDHPSER